VTIPDPEERLGMTTGTDGPVLVTGGTGTLGRLVVGRLVDRGRPVRSLSRRPHPPGERIEYLRGDLRTGAGVAAALDGVSTVVHCASAPKGDADATGTLVRAAAALRRPPHLVFISIVGADRVSFGYIRAKLAAERLVGDSGVPWTILRATQFYDLILAGAAKAARLPVVPVPHGFLVQPVDADDAAARLVELTLRGPSGRVADLGGPQVATAAELVHAYLTAVGRRRRVVELPVPGTRAAREGALLPARSGSDRGERTWAEFLAARSAGPTP
jgi:uncharacterized protein YbjT (DUF2867 family)